MKKINILIVPDSFKNCLTAQEVSDSIQIGLDKSRLDSKIEKIPISDGGEGFCKLLTLAMNGKFESIETVDPLGRKIVTEYGIVKKTNTAILDIASASGLELLKKQQQNPMYTSTFGTGLMIKSIIKKKYRKLIIGLGGSSTTDAGIGIASALGYNFLDKTDNFISLNGIGLGKLAKISTGDVLSEINNTEIIAAYDVNNQLIGTKGSAFTFGKQKGASQKEIIQLNKNLMNFADIVKKDLNVDVVKIKGSGAAGGVGAGLVAFFQAKLVSGIELFFQTTDIANKIRKTDLIITGEGKIDEQTFMGKAPGEILKIAQKYKVPIIAVVGKNEITNGKHFDKFYKIFQLTSSEYTEQESILKARELLINIGEKIGQLVIEKLK
ncbi:MAG: glycerate kinase [Candidatus Cloacimonetes bacterium]|nr:glycerate kinase [Candidatus Cloacimonadota bacterium]